MPEMCFWLSGSGTVCTEFILYGILGQAQSSRPSWSLAGARREGENGLGISALAIF